MKKFLEELKKASMNTYDIEPTSSKAQETLGSIRKKYEPLKGTKAIHTSKVTKETRVVTIEEVRERYMVVNYPHFTGGEGLVRTTIMYSSLLCGDSVLEVEDNDQW